MRRAFPTFFRIGRALTRAGARLLRLWPWCAGILVVLLVAHTIFNLLAGRELARELERARLSKKQALLKTRKLTEEIRRQQQELARKNTPPSLDRALGDLQKIVLESKHGKELAGKLADKKFAEAAAKLMRSGILIRISR